jgi:hypothetical protein
MGTHTISCRPWIPLRSVTNEKGNCVRPIFPEDDVYKGTESGRSLMRAGGGRTRAGVVTEQSQYNNIQSR